MRKRKEKNEVQSGTKAPLYTFHPPYTWYLETRIQSIDCVPCAWGSYLMMFAILLIYNINIIYCSSFLDS